jgi:acetyltransferase-like isoleucine patch superfamily enzyme
MRALLKPWISCFRAWQLRAAGVQLGHGVDLQGPVSIRHLFFRGSRGSIAIDARAQIARGVIIESWGGRVHLGRAVYVGPYTVIYGHGGVEIGDDSLIAMHCTIVSSNHTVPPRSRPIQYEPDVLKPTRIGRDVWLGAHVTVLGGVTIGDGCVVGAGAVVTKDLPAGSIAMGVPAAVVGVRPA